MIDARDSYLAQRSPTGVEVAGDFVDHVHCDARKDGVCAEPSQGHLDWCCEARCKHVSLHNRENGKQEKPSSLQ